MRQGIVCESAHEKSFSIAVAQFALHFPTSIDPNISHLACSAGNKASEFNISCLSGV
jgi:hypothetical protein